MVAANVAPRVVDVAGLGDHLEAGLAVEQQTQPAAHDRVIVGEHDLQGRRVIRGGFRCPVGVGVYVGHRGQRSAGRAGVRP